MSEAEFRSAAVKVLNQYRIGSYRMPSAVVRKEVEQAILFLCPDLMRPILWAGY